MAAARRKKPPHQFRDDRGILLNFAPNDVLEGQLWTRTPIGIWVSRLVLLIPLAGLIVWAIIDRRPPTLGGLIIGLAYGVVFIVARALLVAWRRRSRPDQSPLAAYLAAHRICGACGYDLHAINLEPDGCVVCPECGASWHRDRFVFAELDPRSSWELLRHAVNGHQPATDNTCDDRGVPTRQSWRWPPHWRFSSTSTTLDLDAVASAELRWFHRRAIPVAIAVWGAAVILLLWIKGSPDEFELTVVTIVTLLIAGVCYFAAMRVFIDRAMRRQVTLLGACRNCGRTLPADPPPTFDGCVVCASCKLAWRPRPPLTALPGGPASDRAPAAGAAASRAGAG